MEEVVGYLFNLEVPTADAEPDEPEVKLVSSDNGEGPVARAREVALAKGLEQKAPQNLQYSAPTETGEAQKTSAVATETKRPGRNQPCYCGSGKKYKLCHGAPNA